MPLHHYIEQYFQANPQARSKGIKTDNLPLEKRPKIHQIEDITIDTNSHHIPIRIYTPEEDTHYSLFVFFHGGESIFGSVESYDVPCRLISSLAGVKVISVDYRQPPHHSAETAFQDCYLATKWIVDHAAKLGGRDNDVVVGGASAGATFATAVALKSVETKDFTLAKQVLFYPATDLDKKINDSEYQSRLLYNAKYGLNIEKIHSFLLHEMNGDFPYFSPIKMGKEVMEKLPQTLIFTAEYDPLCDEGELYAEKLNEAGVPVKLVRFDGDIHGFMQSFPGSPDNMRGYDIATEFLNE